MCAILTLFFCLGLKWKGIPAYQSSGILPFHPLLFEPPRLLIFKKVSCLFVFSPIQMRFLPSYSFIRASSCITDIRVLMSSKWWKMAPTFAAFSEYLNFTFLHQLTHNMTTECSLNYKFSTWKLQAQNTLSTQIVFCFDIHYNLCTQHVLSFQFSCTEL